MSGLCRDAHRAIILVDVLDSHITRGTIHTVDGAAVDAAPVALDDEPNGLILPNNTQSETEQRSQRDTPLQKASAPIRSSVPRRHAVPARPGAW